jgi:hypothetical protein
MTRIAELDESPFGVNSHEQSEYITRLATYGIRWYRVDFKWSRVAVTPNMAEWDWSAADSVVRAADDSGASLLVVAAYTPRWASRQQDQQGLSDDQCDALPPIEPARYVEYVEALVRRFAGRIHAISLWNEPNLDIFWKSRNRDQYMAMVLPALHRVREIAPDMFITGPDLSTWPDNRAEDWMSDLIQRKVPQTFYDVITHHQYGADKHDSVNSRVGRIEDFRRFLSKHGLGDKPFWITETGWNYPKFSRDRQVQSMTDLMQRMKQRSAWWKKTFWYDSHGFAMYGKEPVDFGLIGHPDAPDPGSIRPALPAYAQIIRAAGVTPPISMAAAREIVKTLYRVVLRRRPEEIEGDREGVDNNARQLQKTSVEAVCQAFLSSPEFAQRWDPLTPDQIAREIVSNIPGAASDDASVAALAADIQARKAPRIAQLIASSRTA